MSKTISISGRELGGGDLEKDDVSEDLRQHLAAFRRQLPLVLTLTLVTGLVGGIVAANLPRLYTASSQIILDNKRIRAVESNYENQNPAIDNSTSYIESQVEVIRSGRVADAVIEKMNLLETPLPVATTPAGFIFWPFNQVMSVFQEPSKNSAPDSRVQSVQKAIAQLQAGLEVRQVARTTVLNISFTAASPSIAAQVANAYAEAYIKEQLDASFAVTQRASEWLEARLAELKKKAYDADLAVQEFRAKNNLIASSGKLVNEQQITELNSQLVTARAELARAEARFGRLKQIVSSHDTAAVVADSFGSSIVENLRSKYLDASKREADLRTRVGPTHASVIALGSEMREYQHQVFAELSRLEEAYRSDVDIARSKEKSLTSNMDKLLAEAANQNKLFVALKQLEQQADNFRNVYQTYSQRYQEAIQQQSFPIADARVITPAFEPPSPSHPKKTVLTLLFALVGGSIGVVIGFFREHSESGFKNEEQVASDLRIETLGIVPNLPVSRSSQRIAATTDDKRTVLSTLVRDSDLPHDREVELPQRKNWDYVIKHPNSPMGEALLAAKLAIDNHCAVSPCKVIGITSARPGEGKTLIAKNFASLLAGRKAGVLLIDGDLRKRELSRGLAPTASDGLIQVLSGAPDFSSTLYNEPQSGLNVLPVVDKKQIAHSSDVLASPSMQELLNHLKTRYNYIILDLPPLVPMIDARAVASRLDAFLFVIEWRKTPRRLVRNVLRQDEQIYGKCVGAIINKVDTDKINLFSEQGSRFHQYNAYANSYYIDS